MKCNSSLIPAEKLAAPALAGDALDAVAQVETQLLKVSRATRI
ncbi:hypothetical protein FIU89_17445 [Roseovarius sp. THAF27]|nr:hypothetical protein [Roseovarius sp. THAF27]QFT82413.1 hypothetical protein FIU89_17445 [Roseovarius sp. THAF27]